MGNVDAGVANYNSFLINLWKLVRIFLRVSVQIFFFIILFVLCSNRSLTSTLLVSFETQKDLFWNTYMPTHMYINSLHSLHNEIILTPEFNPVMEFWEYMLIK